MMVWEGMFLPCYTLCAGLHHLVVLFFHTYSHCHAHHPLVTGVTGAGRAAKESNLYCEIAEGINSYAVSM